MAQAERSGGEQEQIVLKVGYNAVPLIFGKPYEGRIMLDGKDYESPVPLTSKEALSAMQELLNTIALQGGRIVGQVVVNVNDASERDPEKLREGAKPQHFLIVEKLP